MFASILYDDCYIIPSYVLSLNPVIKRLIKWWNWHVKSVVNVGTVLVLNLTLGAWMLYDVLVMTWKLARRSGESPTHWSMHLFLWLWFWTARNRLIKVIRGDGNPTTFARMSCFRSHRAFKLWKPYRDSLCVLCIRCETYHDQRLWLL